MMIGALMMMTALTTGDRSMVDELPDQLLDVQAIADDRDYWRNIAQHAESLLRDAPIHHYGREYQKWRDMRDIFLAGLGKHATPVDEFLLPSQAAVIKDNGDGQG